MRVGGRKETTRAKNDTDECVELLHASIVVIEFFSRNKRITIFLI